MRDYIVGEYSFLFFAQNEKAGMGLIPIPPFYVEIIIGSHLNITYCKGSNKAQPKAGGDGAKTC